MNETTAEILLNLGTQISEISKKLTAASGLPSAEEITSMSRLVNSYTRLFSVAAVESESPDGYGDQDYLNTLNEV